MSASVLHLPFSFMSVTSPVPPSNTPPLTPSPTLSLSSPPSPPVANGRGNSATAKPAAQLTDISAAAWRSSVSPSNRETNTSQSSQHSPSATASVTSSSPSPPRYPRELSIQPTHNRERSGVLSPLSQLAEEQEQSDMDRYLEESRKLAERQHSSSSVSERDHVSHLADHDTVTAQSRGTANTINAAAWSTAMPTPSPALIATPVSSIVHQLRLNLDETPKSPFLNIRTISGQKTSPAANAYPPHLGAHQHGIQWDQQHHTAINNGAGAVSTYKHGHIGSPPSSHQGNSPSSPTPPTWHSSPTMFAHSSAAADRSISPTSLPLSKAATAEDYSSIDVSNLSTRDVESLMGALSYYYTADVIASLSVSSSPSAIVLAVRDVLRAEGCPFCNHTVDVVDESTAGTPSPCRYVLLTCKVLHCRHIAHLSCLAQSCMAAAHAAHSQKLSPATTITPTIFPVVDQYHSTAAFKVLGFPSQSARITPPTPNDPIGTRQFIMEFAVLHSISNAQTAFVVLPQLVTTNIDPLTHLQYIFLNCTADNIVNNAHTSLPASSGGHQSDLCRFLNTRGRFYLKCIDSRSQSTYEHLVQYDLTQATQSASYPPATNTLIKLVHISSVDDRNVLTLGLHQSSDRRGYALSYLKYEFNQPRANAVVQPAIYRVPVSTPNIVPPSVPSPLLPSRRDSDTPSRLNPAAAAFTYDSHHGADEVVVAASPPANVRHLSGLAYNQNPSPLQRSGSLGNDPHFIHRSQQRPPSISSRSPHHPSAQQSPSTPYRSFNQSQSQSPYRSSMSPRIEPSRDGFYSHQNQSNTPTPPANEWGDEQSTNSANSAYDDDSKLSPFEHDEPEFERGSSLSRMTRRDSGAGDGHEMMQSANEHSIDSPLFLPALPVFPQSITAINGVMTMPSPMLNLSVDAVRGNVLRLAKSHAGSRFIQNKLDSGDPAFFEVFYQEMVEHVPDIMIDNFAHFAIEKLFVSCNDAQSLTLLQRLAPSIAVVACQKHGSFSVQALVDTLHTPAQVYTLVESIKADVMRIMTHASGHFVVLRMLQRFPYAQTKFIDDAICVNCSQVGSDHHGLRVIKAVLCVRRPAELTRLFKQVARLTMKLVENQYGNYVIQAVLDVAPPGVRTNIKVKMEGKYMRLSKQKFSSNVVEKCLKQSSSHWRAIIIQELIAMPAVAELLRDRYGNYVLQTAVGVANAQQVQDIIRAINPFLPSLRDNVRSKWKKMLRKAGQMQGAAGGGTPLNQGNSAQFSPPPSPSHRDNAPDSPDLDDTNSEHNAMPPLSLHAQTNMNNQHNAQYLTSPSSYSGGGGGGGGGGGPSFSQSNSPYSHWGNSASGAHFSAANMSAQQQQPPPPHHQHSFSNNELRQQQY